MKNYQSGFYIRNNHLKILFLMICMVTLALSLRANVTAQTKINLNLKSVTFNDLFLEIQKQTKMNFVFNADQLKEVGKIDLTAKDESINSLLERVLTPVLFHLCHRRNNHCYCSKRQGEPGTGTTGNDYHSR